MKTQLVRMLSGSYAQMRSLPDQILVGLTLMAMFTWVFPQHALAQSIQATTSSNAFEIEILKENSLFADAGENLAAREIPGTKVAILKDYLASKNSPLTEHVEVLLLQPNWKLVLAISHAESNMCKRQLGNNCWGIGGVTYHRFYPTFSEGIEDADALLQKYIAGGLDTPERIMRRWVGWHNYNWVKATNQILAQIENLGL